MISCDNISYSIDNQLIIDRVNCVFKKGKMNFIIGANGAGKSTLIKLLSGQIKLQRGHILYGDKHLYKIKQLEISRIKAVLSQNLELAFPLSVQEVVIMGRYPHFEGTPNENDLQICDEVLKYVDMLQFRKRNYLSLSGGEKQRVQFARVLAQIWDNHSNENPDRYLFLDEPLTFLDVKYQYLFLQQLKEIILSRNITMVGVIHDLNLVALFADKLVLMKEGMIINQGHVTEVLTEENIRTAYNWEVKITKDSEGYIHFLPSALIN